MTRFRAMAIIIFIGLLIWWVFVPKSQASEEPQSVSMQFRVKTSDGVTRTFDKSIPFSAMGSIESGHSNFECVVELEKRRYRLGFWANSYPILPFSAVNIRYSFGGVGGMGLAMPYKTFSAHNEGASIIVDVFSTKFINSLRESFPNQYKDNLDCRTF